MPVHWAFRVFEESAALEPRWHMVALFLVVLAGHVYCPCRRRYGVPAPPA